ncbi:MAG TPA: acireductone synthase [Pyrinomonadaceae bacterium]|nr:acireductone synthase [Pyrinomonadaceae bacterium]
MTKAILLDIEGTTTPIDFVYRTLFPFAKRKIGKFVEMHFRELSDEIKTLVNESSRDATYTLPVDPAEPGSVTAYLEHLIDLDRKSTPLKTIQGMIWKEGYEAGELCSIVFDDVPAAFERWTSTGLSIAIYSSGSILAQQLIFKYSDHGDLTSFISNYFDTTTGGKREVLSYAKIADALCLDPSCITFISDTAEELAAARDSRFNTLLAVRPGNARQENASAFDAIASFDQIDHGPSEYGSG